jgi:RHS repeat-associated protein
MTSSSAVDRRFIAPGIATAMLLASCSSASLSTSRESAVTITQATFFHAGFAAGPAVFTDAAGNPLEERRYEPFGTPIDARIRTGTAFVVGDPDVVARDLNTLNKRTEAVSGWSDHGARWLAPETGRWLTTDPPVEGPDAKFMFAPWRLHPYQYVDQNPVSYWDPDGRELAKLKGLETCHSCDLPRHTIARAPEKLLKNLRGSMQSTRAFIEDRLGPMAIFVPTKLAAAVVKQPRFVIELLDTPRAITRDVAAAVLTSAERCAPLPTLGSIQGAPEPTTVQSTSRPPHLRADFDTRMRFGESSRLREEAEMKRWLEMDTAFVRKAPEQSGSAAGAPSVPGTATGPRR